MRMRTYIYETVQHDAFFTGRLFRKLSSNIPVVSQSVRRRHSRSGWLNALAFQNIQLVFVTLWTRHWPSGWLKRRGAVEHPIHTRDLVDPPLVQRLVERRGAFEHAMHIPDVVDAPVF